MNPAEWLTAFADAVLAAWAVVVGACFAALAIGLGHRTGTALAIRHQGRQLTRYCQLYINHPGIRTALDTNYQPRKEN